MIYQFRLINNLDHLMNQKYRPLSQIRDEYPAIVDQHMEGRFPTKIVKLRQKNYGVNLVLDMSLKVVSEDVANGSGFRWN